jgi:hypothetical protein
VSRPWPLLTAAVLALALAAPQAPAQIDLSVRNSFPGRRIGGNTRSRNICWTRQFAHLVPVDSVVAPGEPLRIGVLEGPSDSPRVLRIDLQSLRPDGQIDPVAPPLLQRLLPAAPAGITLLTLPPLRRPLSWSSSYVCVEAPPPPDDPLYFITSGEPPALSLLLPGPPSAADERNRKALERLSRSCGGSVSHREVMALFGFTDLEGPHWPLTLPVRCP